MGKEKDVMDRLPTKCFVVEPATQKVVIVKRGVKGYYPCPNIPPRQDPQKWADEMNTEDGVTKFQADAMLNGSMWGFHVPAADPAVLEAEAAKKGRTEEFYPRKGGKKP